jgi:RNA polymerase sigma-70 factor (ECF subfamily)
VKPATQVLSDERDLIALAQKGDRAAYGQLVSSHRQGVVNVVYRLCGDAHLAEDMAQETFLRAWQKLPDYQPKAPFRHWVYRIATNAALDALRRRRETLDVDEMQVAEESPGMEAKTITAARDRTVQQAVLALPVSSRSVIILREYEDLSYQEIAETLDIPVGTVMSRLSYARSKLRESLVWLLEEDL